MTLKFNEADAIARYRAFTIIESKNRQKADDQRLARALIVASAKASLDADEFKAFLKKIECADSTSRELLQIAKVGNADDVRRATALRVADHRARKAAVTLPYVTAPPLTPVTPEVEPLPAAPLAYSQHDPLVIPNPKHEEEIVPSPWFASIMRPIIDSTLKNDPKKSAAALVAFRQACIKYLPQMTLGDLIENIGSARDILSVVGDLQFTIEREARDAKNAKVEARRIAREAKNPQEAKEAAHAEAQEYAVENEGEDIDEAKKEARENGETWADKKDDWLEEQIEAVWDDEHEAEFEKDFAAQWQQDHGAPFPEHKNEERTS